jgi:hypothetical protein
MPEPRDRPPPINHVEAALDASCGALVTLESFCPDPLQVGSGVQQHVRCALRALREAIAELRLAEAKDSSGLALGFVLEATSARPDANGLRPGQSKPRRTA